MCHHNQMLRKRDSMSPIILNLVSEPIIRKVIAFEGIKLL